MEIGGDIFGNAVSIDVHSEALVLLGEKAVFWPRQRTLFLAELHCGKTATFRAAAIPVPGGTTTENLRRLDRAMAATKAERLIVLGDLLHARLGRARKTLAALSAWRARHSQLQAVLVRGNHDRHAGDPPAECGFECVDEPLPLAPFVLRHYPMPSCDGYVLAGHVHPAVRLVGAGGHRESLACFVFAKDVAILPAFGEFTGVKKIVPQPSDRIFACTDGEVVELSR